MVWMFLFTVVPFLAMAYIGWHVWCLLPLAWGWKLAAVIVMVASFLLMFGGIRRTTDQLPLEWGTAMYETGTSSVFILLYLFILFLVLDLGRLLHLVPRTLLYNNGWTACAIALFMFGLFLYGNLHYKHKYRQELTVQSEKVHKPLRLVMLSDLHLGYHNRRDEFHRWVDLINAEHPDLILIAGDIIDGSMRPVVEERMAEEFRRLEAPVYACLGNHEFYSGLPEARQFYRDAGIRLLIDETAVIDSCITVIGRDDRTNMRRKPVRELVPSLRETYTIVLDHQPYNLDRTEQAGVDFQLSGHTHRGQVWPISWITDRVYECSWGSHQRGSTRYYISSGIGIWGGKFRIGTQSEYVVATLHSSFR